MSAGNFDRFIVIQAPVQKRGKAGGVSAQWDDFASCWATKEDVSGGETRRGTQLVPEANVVFELRHWIYGLNTKHRIVLDDVVYDVLFVREIGRQESAEVQAVARSTSKP